MLSWTPVRWRDAERRDWADLARSKNAGMLVMYWYAFDTKGIASSSAGGSFIPPLESHFCDANNTSAAKKLVHIIGLDATESVRRTTARLMASILVKLAS